MKKRYNTILSIILFLTYLLNYSVKWVLANYGLISFEEIIFHLTVPINGTEKSLIASFINNSLFPSILLSLLSIIILLILKKLFYNIKLIGTINIREKIYKINLKPLCIQRMFAIFIIFICLYNVYGLADKIGLINFIYNKTTESKFIENNYIDPEKVEIIFPEQKRNLIYIYVESLETTYLSQAMGGVEKINLLPKLSELAEKNINFSNTEKLGGALQIGLTGWTMSAMIAQTAGLPSKIDFTNDINNYGYDGYSSMLQGATSIGDILAKNGYKNEIIFGSDAKFGGRNIYFTGHGNYKIYDYYTAKEEGRIPSDYMVWWGFEDSKLLTFAQDEIVNLSNNNQPFNMTILTSNTHHIGGYLEEDCPVKYEEHLANVITCTDNQLYLFIKWIQSQKFYNNTTIIISGDHLSMDPTFFVDIDENYIRTTYNIIINSAVTQSNNKNRLFSTMDLYPTTLASLGVKISGNKLALGTNLFSTEKTTIEQYGFDYVNEQLNQNSSFYNKKFIFNK